MSKNQNIQKPSDVATAVMCSTPAVSPTHSQLVDLARIWLSRRCSVVITEMCGAGREEPDAIGWDWKHSILVECKVSKTDFRADQRKSYRRGKDDPDWEVGMGEERYYLAPKGMITPAMLADERWGILETDGKKIRKTKDAGRFPVDLKAERSLLLSAVRRIGEQHPKCMSVKFYTYETKQRGTLGIVEG